MVMCAQLNVFIKEKNKQARWQNYYYFIMK